MIVTQLVFLLGAWAIELCRPIRKRRLLLTVLIASGLMTSLVTGCAIALLELFRAKSLSKYHWHWVALIWLCWAVVFFLHCQRLERWQVVKRLITAVLAGSLADLLASVPAHIMVIRRTGCHVGLGTAAGIAAGICAMLWAFGPGVVLLFLKEGYRDDQTRN
jgi:hypothetical protein